MEIIKIHVQVVWKNYFSFETEAKKTKSKRK